VLAHIIWLFIQCLYHEEDTDSYIIFVGSMHVLWAVDSMRMGHILVPILCFLVQCLYYEADIDSYIIFVGSIHVL
jgi:hypothetical protein